MPFLILGGALLLILTVALCAARWVFGKAFYAPNHKKMADPRDFYSQGKDAVHKNALVALVDELEPRPFEAVSIISRDGLRLTGRYYHTADGAPLKFIFHGWRSNVLRDCGGGAKMAHPVLGVVLRGFVTLYPDFLLRWVIYVGETPLVVSPASRACSPFGRFER